MKLTQEELTLLFFALNSDKENKPRTFQFTELGMISGLSDKFRPLLKDGTIGEGEHPLELTTDEKKLLKDMVTERNWMIGDAAHILTLTEKLSK